MCIQILILIWSTTTLTADMCMVECNITNESSSGALITAIPKRSSLLLVLTQMFVWPSIYINILMLFTFSRKQAFKTESRYILFAYTLLVDFIFLLLTDFAVILSYSYVLMPMAFCIPFCMLMEVVSTSTPLTITAMCVERYVAICMPLRHSAISTSSRTLTAILVIWIISFINPVMDVLVLVASVSQEYLTQYTFCYYEIMTPEKWHRLTRGFLYIAAFVFILLVEFFCYLMIVLTARAASVDNKSAGKGLRTVLLHMFQLILCALGSVCPYVEELVQEIDVQMYVIIRFFNFIAFNVIAKAVSPLIYGLRDEKFYSALVYYVRCKQNYVLSENREKKP